jgi:hypothetical protein
LHAHTRDRVESEFVEVCRLGQFLDIDDVRATPICLWSLRFSFVSWPVASTLNTMVP